MELFNVCFVLQVAKMPSMSGIVQNATMTIARHHASNLKILGGQDRPGFSWAQIKVARVF